MPSQCTDNRSCIGRTARLPTKRQERTTRAQLTSCANGCKNVLDDLDYLLAKYTTLNGEGKPSVGKMVWQRFKFESKINELGVVRGNLIIYS